MLMGIRYFQAANHPVKPELLSLFLLYRHKDVHEVIWI